MNTLSGHCLHLGRSERFPAQIQWVDGGGVYVTWQENGAERCASYPLEQLHLSDAIGRVPQYLICPDGLVFHATDPVRLREAFAQAGGAGDRFWVRWVHQLERHKTWIMGAVMATILSVFLFYRFAIPPLVVYISDKLPVSVYELMGQQSFSMLERWSMTPSQIPEERQAELTRQFDSFVQKNPQLFVKTQPKLYFKDWSDMPNAFTLVDGKIIITDDLLEMMDNQQAYGVLLHELGHAHKNHVMHATVRASLLSIGVALLVGDASSLADTMVSFGVLALNMDYSRDMENEADDFAGHHLKAQGFGVVPLIQAFEKLESTRPLHEGKTDENGVELKDWFASHPDTSERIERLRRLEAEH